MKQSDLSDIKSRIARLAKKSSVGKRVRNVVVETGDYGDGTEFLRVVLQMRDLDSLEPKQIQPLIQLIEDEVARVDERFPSVRFAEAA
jgi:hypothetical protein